MHWAAKYIGLPYCLGGREPDGLDCYGLVRLIYHQERRILLPDLPGVAHSTRSGVDGIQQQCSAWTEIERPQDGCAVGMSQSTLLHHVGVWADVDGGKVVHAQEGCNVVAETLRSLRFKGFKVIRFFAYGAYS